jgi:hypothetical protein
LLFDETSPVFVKTVLLLAKTDPVFEESKQTIEKTVFVFTKSFPVFQ